MSLRTDLQTTWPTPHGLVYCDSFWRCLRPVMMKPTHLPLGTISEGTLKVEDLLPRLVTALLKVDLRLRDYAAVSSINTEIQAVGVRECNVWYSDSYSEVLDIAQDYAPNDAYVGMHEGDGALFGVWYYEQSDEEEGR